MATKPVGAGAGNGPLTWLAKRSAILKDQLIPQIAPARQTYSLARSQMAWWSVVVLGSFLYVFFVNMAKNPADFSTVLDNIVTSQAVMLMGISVLTAGGAGAVDAMQDTPEDAVNDALKLLGLSNYQDVLDLKQAITALDEAGTNQVVLNANDQLALRAAQDAALTLPANAHLDAAEQDTFRAKMAAEALLTKQADLLDKTRLLKTYEDKTRPFETQGWFTDLTADVSGTALHRLQALGWTVVLGVIFVYLVAKSSKFPELDINLLALMGVSNAGYVGFKMNETQY